MQLNTKKGSFITLLPFLVFVITYLFTGVYLIKKGDPMGFYGFKTPIAAIIGIILAFLIIKGNINEKFEVFVRGCGDTNIIIMCIIYLLAGAFSTVSSFISISTGTSVGTIVALGQVAVGFCEKTSISMPLMLGALVGGAMFGDNLSIISIYIPYANSYIKKNPWDFEKWEKVS